MLHTERELPLVCLVRNVPWVWVVIGKTCSRPLSGGQIAVLGSGVL